MKDNNKIQSAVFVWEILQQERYHESKKSSQPITWLTY